MSTKHTPGPWRIEDSVPLGRLMIMAPSDNVDGDAVAEVATTGDEEYDASVTAANASLIACAPETLASLEEILAWMGTAMIGTDMAPGGWPMIDRARAVIARAKGGKA